MDSVPLFHRTHGDPSLPPIVILHGLLGSSRNWHSAARALTGRFSVSLLDLRNHGQSPHSDDHSVALMVKDVLRWLDEQELQRVHLLGHSMGGKVAMRLACDEPDRIDRLTIVDIAPKDYPSGSSEIRAMQKLEPAGVSSRLDAEAKLKEDVPDLSTRRFLLTNLERNDGPGFRWQINLPALARNLADMRRSPLVEGDRFDGPTLFVLGGKSPFVADADHLTLITYFPATEIVVLPQSGHNPHVEDRDAFVKAVTR